MNIPQIYQQVFDDNMANYKKEDENNLKNLDQYRNQLFVLNLYYTLELNRISAEIILTTSSTKSRKIISSTKLYSKTITKRTLWSNCLGKSSI